jgi:hypothetical protein
MQLLTGLVPPRRRREQARAASMRRIAEEVLDAACISGRHPFSNPRRNWQHEPSAGRAEVPFARADRIGASTSVHARPSALLARIPNVATYRSLPRSPATFQEGIVTTQSVELDQWLPVHSGRVVKCKDGIELHDSPVYDWHLIRATNDLYAARLRLTIEAKPCAEGNTGLGLNCWGGYEPAFVTGAGESFERGAESVSVERLPDGWLRIAIVWDNYHPTVSFGPAQMSPMTGHYQGQGRRQWIVRKAEIDRLPKRPRNQLGARLTFVDVGARDGLDPQWAMLDNPRRKRSSPGSWSFITVLSSTKMAASRPMSESAARKSWRSVESLSPR